MADEKLLVDSINMEALGYGIFENAQSVDEGRAALVNAYNEYDWSDPNAAQETLSYYGEQLKYKFKDQSNYSADDLMADKAPVTLLDLNPQTDEDYDSLYDTWRDKNLAYLDETTEPEYIVAKKQLKEDITKAAADAKREGIASDIRETTGDAGVYAIDKINRFALGAVSTVSAPIKWATGYELDDRITEVTDPTYDKDFGAALSQGLGQAGAMIASGRYAGALAPTAEGVGMGIESTRERYNESLQRTGDPSVAKKASGIEAGSQLLQTAVTGTVFGRIATRAIGGAGKTAIGTLAAEAGAEAVSEGAGQVISNVAENVGNLDPATQDVWRGVGTAAAVGGIAAGAGGAIVSASNSGTRMKEIEEFGAPLTPVTKQTIGPVHETSVEENEIAGDTKTNSDPEGLSTQNVETPKAPAFKTEDGSTYSVDREGLIYKGNADGSQGEPFDNMAYVSQNALSEITSALNEGGQVVAGEKGPEMELADGQKIGIPYSTEPIEGYVPLQYSEQKKPNKDTIVRPIQIGAPITETFDRSLGAASLGGAPVYKETTYGRKLRESETIAPAMQATGEEGVYYITSSRVEYDPDIKQQLEQRGIQSLLDDFSNNNFVDMFHKGRAQVAAHNFFHAEMLEAAELGDTAKHDMLESMYKRAVPYLTGTDVAQGLAARQGMNEVSPARALETKQRVYEAELATEAAEEGVSPIEIAESDKKIADIDQQIKVVKDESKLIKDQTKEAEKELSKLEAEQKEIETALEPKEEGTKPVSEAKRKKYNKRKEAIPNELAAVKEIIRRNEAKQESVNNRVDKLETEKGPYRQRSERKQRAKKKAIKAAAEVSARQQEIADLKQMIKDENLQGNTRSQVERKISELESVDDTNPVSRRNHYNMWLANIIGSVFNPIVGTTSAALSVGTKGVLGNIATDALNLTKSGTKSQTGAYLKGIKDAALSGKPWAYALNTLLTGERVKNIIPNQELIADIGVYKKKDTAEFSPEVDDYLVRMWPTKEDSALKKVGKAIAALPGIPLRVLAAVETASYLIHDQAFDRSAAAYYYNKGVGSVTAQELAQYQYDPEANWKRAQIDAQLTGDKLRAAGVAFPKSKEKILAQERLQQYRPRAVQVDAFKAAAGIVLNAPAPGALGTLVQGINQMHRYPVTGVAARYALPLANSITQLLQQSLEVTPLGALGAAVGKRVNRTAYEQSMMYSSALTGSIGLAGIAGLALAELEKPEGERFFDIIGKYSADDGQRDVFMQSGGLLYSIKIGGVYIPFSETPLVVGLGTIAALTDAKRDSKEYDPTVGGLLLTATFGGLNAAQNMSMLRTINELTDAMHSKTPEEGIQKVTRTLINNVKGHIPAAGLLRNIARYTDNPVEAKKDMMSALVEGLPGLQSAFGRPALNVFGEVMPSETGALTSFTAIHRIFSTKKDDIDIRWLSDNGYTIPGKENIRTSKAIGNIKLDYEMKYNIMKEAGPEIRQLVSRYRNMFGSSARRESVQEALDKDVNAVIAKYKVKLFPAQ